MLACCVFCNRYFKRLAVYDSKLAEDGLMELLRKSKQSAQHSSFGRHDGLTLLPNSQRQSLEECTFLEVCHMDIIMCNSAL